MSIETVSGFGSPSVGAEVVVAAGAAALALRPVDADAYELGRELARGGMGRIVEAVDLRHHRRVALKLLLDPSPAHRRRFAREVALTARLQHPSIIALHEAGLLPSGEQFYAMRLVPGRSLADAVAAIEAPAERLRLVPSLVALCDAMAYAHGKGIIHRDLKPANVLVGDFGETVVIDWGLAQDLRAGEPPAGAPMGTAAYMPVEQAHGDAVDERADVYALGALMYHVLTGAAPYAGVRGRDLLAAVLAGPPPALRTVAPDLPADLAAIVDKAMARAPEARYPTARELAADLRAFAAGKLVSAYRYPLATLARRFLARHRAALAVSAVLGAALAVTIAASVRRVAGERDAAMEARRMADRHREGAEQLVEFMLRTLGVKLRAQGKLELLEGVIGEVEGYLDAVELSSTAPEVLQRRIAALLLLAEVRKEQGRYGLEEAIRKRALAMSEGLPPGRDRQKLRANVLRRIATAVRQQARPDESRRWLDAALAELGRDGDAVIRATVLVEMAEHLSRAGDSPAALRALDVARALLPEKGNEYQLARTENAAATILRLGGRLEDAGARYARAAELLGRLLSGAPDDQVNLSLLGSVLNGASRTAFLRGDLAGARAEGARALALWERLAELDPGHHRSKQNLAVAVSAMGDLEKEAGRLDEAERHFERALALDAALAADSPDDDISRSNLAAAHLLLADVRLERGVPRDAAAHVASARTLVDDALARQPGHQTWVVLAIELTQREGQVALRERRFDQAVERFERAVRLAGEAQAALRGQNDRIKALECEALGMLASARRARGEVEAAAALEARAKSCSAPRR